MNSKRNIFFKSFLFILCVFGISFGLLLVIKDFISYPKGADIFGYLFRTNILYDSISNGDIYPIYTQYWYNGTEMFRSWPPLAYYFHAFLTFLTNGDVLNSYYLFLIFCFVLSCFGWLLFGFREDRIGLSFVISIFYFFMPDNLRVMLSEGNIARVLLMALFPYFFYFVMEFIYYKKRYALIFMSLLIVLITFTHLMIAAMLGISLFILMLIYAICNKEYKNPLICIINTILSYLLAGIILIPGIFGGMLGLSSSVDSELAMWTEELSVSINPFLRITNISDIFYFSTVLLVFLFLGIICYRKKNFVFFLSSFIIYLLTSSELIPLFKLLPLSQIFWMKRMVPIAYVFAFIGIIYWKKLRKIVLILLFILLALDIVPSLQLFDTENIEINTNDFNNSDDIQIYIDKKANEILLDKAVEIVDNRIMILDESSFGAIPSYYLSANSLNCNFVSGWGLQGATIRENIVRVNEAFKNGYYYYTFDRLIELGADTVILKKNFVKDNDFEELEKVANELNYYLVSENDKALLYKLNNIDGTFGTINKYKYLAIGESSYYIEYLYPTFLQGDSYYIDDYTFDDLVKYEKIYLSGFKYRDKEYVEKLLEKLAKNDVEIFIDMNNIPPNNSTGKADFLGVIAQEIFFTDKFPVLEVNGYQFKLDFQTNMYSNWLTVYLTNTDKIKASSYYLTYPKLTYWGTDESENINFLGFNLLYYCVENKTEDLLLFFDEVFNISPEETPQREIINLDITYNTKNDKIIINSEKDNVNSNLSNCDCFIYDLEKNNMLIVNEGETIIEIEYPMLLESIIVTVFGFIAIMIFWIIIFIRGGKIENKE